MARPLLTVVVVFALRVTGLVPEEESRLPNGDAFCEPECRCVGRRMNCSFAGMETLPVHIPGAAAVVDLSHNAIGKVSSCDVRNGEWTVKHLNLSDNKISKIVLSAFKRLTVLETLNLNGNILQYISLSGHEIRPLFAKKSRGKSKDTCLPSLKQLLIKKNKLAYVPKGLWMLNSLNLLDLSFNEITQIAWDDFQNCTQLTCLHLQDNKINTLHPGAFKDLRTLQVLNLANNALKNIVPVTLALLNLPQLHVELSNNPWECAFRLCAIKSTTGFLSEPFRTRWNTKCSETLGISMQPQSPLDFDLDCKATLHDLITFKDVTISEAEDAVQICGSTTLHGNEVMLQWTHLSRTYHGGMSTFVIYKSDASKEGLHRCMPNMKNKWDVKYTGLKEKLLANPVRTPRDVRSNRAQVRTQEDFTLAVCLSVIITFICAFCLGFFLRPYIQILFNKIGRNKQTDPEETYQNHGFSDEYLEEENDESVASRSPNEPGISKEKLGNVCRSTEHSPRHGSDHYDHISPNRQRKGSFSGSHLQKPRDYYMAQHKNWSERAIDVEADMSDVTDKMHHSPKLQPGQFHALNYNIFGNKDSKERVFVKDMDGSVSKEEIGVHFKKQVTQDNLLKMPRYTIKDIPTNRSTHCPERVTNTETPNVVDNPGDDRKAEWNYSSSDGETEQMTANKGRGENTAAINLNFKPKQQTLEGVVSIETNIGSAGCSGEYNAVSGENDDSSGAGPLTFQSATVHLSLLKHLQFIPRTCLTSEDQKVLRETDCTDHFVENDFSVGLGDTIKGNTSIQANCEKEHLKEIDNTNNCRIEIYSTGDIRNLGQGTENFNFEDSSSDEGSSFKFSPSSSFSGSDWFTPKASSDSSLSEQSLAKMDGLTTRTHCGFSTPSPSHQSAECTLSPEINEGSGISPAMSVPSQSNSDVAKSSELDFKSTKHPTLTEATTCHEVLYGQQQVNPSLIQRKEVIGHLNRTLSTIPNELHQEIAMGTEGIGFKDNSSQHSEYEYSAQMLNIIPLDNLKEFPVGNRNVETLDNGEIHKDQKVSQNSHGKTMSEVGYDGSSQTKEDHLTPRPVDFGSTWATYIYAEPTWQSSRVTDKPLVAHEFNREDDTNVTEEAAMAGYSLQEDVGTMSQNRAREERDSREWHWDRLSEEILHPELHENEHDSRKRERQYPSIGNMRCLGEIHTMTGGGMDNYTKVNHQCAEYTLPTLPSQSLFSGDDMQYNSPASRPYGVLAKTTVEVISEKTAMCEPGMDALSKAQDECPRSLLKYINVETSEAETSQDAAQGRSIYGTKGASPVKKRSVFEGFISSLESGKK